MKKMEVKGIVQLSYITILITIKSGIGSDRTKNHSLMTSSHYIPNTKIEDIRKGDVLRCDGLPFMSRPKPVAQWVNGNKRVYHKDGTLFFLNEKQITHSPYQLKSGYWVLRPLEVSK